MSSKKSKGWVIFLVIVLAGGLLSGGWYYFNNKNVEAANGVKQEIKTVTSIKGDILVAISADGISKHATTNLNFKNNGIVEDIFVKEGQLVNRGTVLAKVTTENLHYQVEQAEANYNGAMAKLEKLKSSPSSTELALKELAVENARNSLGIAEEVFALKEELYNEEKLSQLEYLAEKSKLENAKVQLKTAEIQLEAVKQIDPNDLKVAEEAMNQAKAALDIAKKNLDNVYLRAPEKGVVLSINGKKGENSTVTTGGQLSTGFIVLGEEQQIYVEANILEDDIGQIELDQKVMVSFDAVFGENFDGTVSSIANTATVEQSGITTYKVQVKLDNYDVRIKGGMSASLSFIFARALDVVSISNEAVKRLDGSTVVEIQLPDGNTEMRKIKTGLTDGVRVEVAEGLEAGETIVIRKTVIR